MNVNFKMGKKYSLTLKNGDEALVCRYVSPYSDDVRIAYAISSGKGFIFKDLKTDGLPEDTKNLLLEMYDIINPAETAGENKKPA